MPEWRNRLEPALSLSCPSSAVTLSLGCFLTTHGVGNSKSKRHVFLQFFFSFIPAIREFFKIFNSKYRDPVEIFFFPRFHPTSLFP